MTNCRRRRRSKKGRAAGTARRMLALTAAVITLVAFYTVSGLSVTNAVFQKAADSGKLAQAAMALELGEQKTGGMSLLRSLGILRTMAVAESGALLGSREQVLSYLYPEEDPATEPSAQPSGEPASGSAKTSPIPSPSPSPAAATDNSKKIVEKTLIPVSSEKYEFIDGVYVSNQTGQAVNVAALAAEKIKIKLGKKEPQVLIIHTHGSEAYAPEGKDTYAPSDPDRTENMSYNVIRVGDEMAKAFEKEGISVIHDRALYDYPSYNGCYARSLTAIESYLKKYPSIQFVFDIHRDALVASDGTKYKVVAQAEGKKVAQVMLVVGTNDSGLEHPKWKENLKLAMKIQQQLNQDYPNLARPISLRSARFNQHATTGSLLVEMGSTGNTLQEAIASARIFVKSTCKVMKSLK